MFSMAESSSFAVPDPARDEPDDEPDPMPPEPCLYTLMMVRSLIDWSVLSFCSLMPAPSDTMITIEQHPTITPSTVSIVRDFRRNRFWLHICRMSVNFMASLSWRKARRPARMRARRRRPADR